jgi:flagella basal body P-ring formation protein FlgA
MRIPALLLSTILLSTAAPPALAEDPPPQPTLKAAARVVGAHIVLGDLFDGAGPEAQAEIAASPSPGGTMIFTATWLAGIAQSHGLHWRAPSPLTTIRVERTATELSAEDIAKRIATALDLDRPDRRVVMDTSLRLFASAEGPPDIAVDHLKYDRETNHFTAEIRIGAADQDATPIHVSGRVQSLVELAVLGRAVMPGDVIRADDVSTDWVRVELAPPGGVTDPRLLVGKTPRRPLRAATPVRPSDVELPVVIKRNDLVLIVLERPGIYLTAQGKALEDGGQGSTIRVANTQSNRTVDAVVLGTGKVAVQPAGLGPATF